MNSQVISQIDDHAAVIAALEVIEANEEKRPIDFGRSTWNGWNLYRNGYMNGWTKNKLLKALESISN